MNNKKCHLACLIGVALFSACAMPIADDEDLVVYVGDQTQEVAELTEEDYKIIQDQRDYMDQFYNFDISTYKNNPDVKQSAFLPDTFIALPDGSGYVGYVDLGLPSGTKWAVMNVGSTPITKDLVPFSQYFNRSRLEEPDLERFTIADSLKDVIPYEEYVRLGRGKDPDAQMNRVWDDYLSACKAYVKAFEQARDEYCEMLKEAHFAWLNCPQRYVLYGRNTLMKAGDKAPAQLPSTLVGKQNDAATNLWGSHWATPSHEQFAELLTSNSKTGISITYGSMGDGEQDYFGTIITGRTGKKLFLPWAYTCSPENQTAEGSNFTSSAEGFYMLNATETDLEGVTTSVHINRSKREIKLYYATNGVSLRPVYCE